MCYTVLFAGGGITPGAIYGASDRIGAYPATDPVTPDDIAATMFWALGIDPATEVRDTLGRPLPIAAGQADHADLSLESSMIGELRLRDSRSDHWREPVVQTGVASNLGP